MRKRKWTDWKRRSYTGAKGWETFFRKSKNGKKWTKTNYGITSPYDSNLWKFNK